MPQENALEAVVVTTLVARSGVAVAGTNVLNYVAFRPPFGVVGMFFF